MKKIPSLVLTAFLSFMSFISLAQDDLNEAGKLAAAGKYDDAIGIYSTLLSKNANATGALIARGYVYAWKHDFVQAKSDFSTALVQDSGNKDAQKGLAYVALWSGAYKTAVEGFSKLSAAFPNKEMFTALALSQMNAGQLKEARKNFAKASVLDPSDQEIIQLIMAVDSKPGILELDMLGGVAGTGGNIKTGIRWIQLSSQLSPRINLSVRYDNSLSIDNGGLILRNQSAPYYAGSMLYNWKGKALTRVEAGFRQYPANSVAGALTGNETQFGLEQVLFLKKNRSIKAGVMLLSPDSGSSGLLLMAGYRQTLGKKITAGLSYFNASRSQDKTVENRMLADADIRLQKGIVINPGLYYGIAATKGKTGSANTYGGFIRGYFPLSKMFGLHIGIAAEKNQLQSLLNLNAGFKIRLEK